MSQTVQDDGLRSVLDLGKAGQAQDRLVFWLARVMAAMETLEGVNCLSLRIEMAGQHGAPGVAVMLPEDRIAPEITAIATQEAQRLARVALAGALPGKAGTTALALPILQGDHPAGIVTVEAELADEAALTQVINLVGLTLGWPRALLLEATAEASSRHRGIAADALEAVVSLTSHAGFSESVRALTTDLAMRFNYDRVSLGLARGRRIRLEAISHTGRFSRSLGLARRLKAAMEEAFDQGKVLLWPDAGGADLVMDAQAELADKDTTRHVLTVPMFDGRAFQGGIVFERGAGRGFSPDEVATLEALTSVLTPLVIEKRQNDRWLPMRTLIATRNTLGLVIGRTHFAVKLGVLAAVAVLVALVVIQAPRSIAARAVVQGTETRTIAAAFDGFLAEAPVREGDRVHSGDLLFRLDDRDFVLELLRLDAVRGQAQLELDRAISQRDRAEAGLIESRIRQIDAQIALARQQMDRSRVTAPFDAVILSGDLTHGIGRSVTRGEGLIVLAPLDDYRVDMLVPEDSIALIAKGQSGVLKLSGLPGQSFELTLTDVVPVARYEGGQTLFSVEAGFATPPGVLLHGMNGAARIDIDQVSLMELWMGALWNRARLWLWRYLPV